VVARTGHGTHVSEKYDTLQKLEEVMQQKVQLLNPILDNDSSLFQFRMVRLNLPKLSRTLLDKLDYSKASLCNKNSMDLYERIYRRISEKKMDKVERDHLLHAVHSLMLPLSEYKEISSSSESEKEPIDAEVIVSSPPRKQNMMEIGQILNNDSEPINTNPYNSHNTIKEQTITRYSCECIIIAYVNSMQGAWYIIRINGIPMKVFMAPCDQSTSTTISNAPHQAKPFEIVGNPSRSYNLNNIAVAYC
jgi:hypothetical protein